MGEIYEDDSKARGIVHVSTQRTKEGNATFAAALIISRGDASFFVCKWIGSSVGHVYTYCRVQLYVEVMFLLRSRNNKSMTAD